MTGTMLRVVTINLWQEQGPWERRIQFLIQSLRELTPDAICFQEVRDVAEKIPNQAKTIADALGYQYAYAPAEQWGGGDEGLAILSRVPIEETEWHELPRWENRCRRICLGIAINPVSRRDNVHSDKNDAGDHGRVWIFTTHLAYLMEDGALREEQVIAADRFIKDKRRAEDLTIFTGDFNTEPQADEIRYLKGLTSIDGKRSYYQDAFALCHPDEHGFTWSKCNPYTEPLTWLQRDRRLDYIFVSKHRSSGRGAIHRCDIVFDRPNEEGIWCSDHFGLMADVMF